MFPFSRKERNRMTAFFWINAIVRKRTFYSIFGEEVIRTESKPRNMVRKGLFKAAYHCYQALEWHTPIFYEDHFSYHFVWVCVLFDTYLQKSFRRCQLLWKSAFVCGQIVSIWLNMWIPTFTELGWQAKLKTLVLAALLKLLIGFLSYALIKDYLDSCVQLHGWTVECKLTTETLGVSCSQTTAQYKLTEWKCS